MAITGWRNLRPLSGGDGGWTLGALRVWERRVRRADKAGKRPGTLVEYRNIAAPAAKAATRSIPIVFAGGAQPPGRRAASANA